MLKQLVFFLWYLWLIGFLVTVIDVLFVLFDVTYDFLTGRSGA